MIELIDSIRAMAWGLVKKNNMARPGYCILITIECLDQLEEEEAETVISIRYKRPGLKFSIAEVSNHYDVDEALNRFDMELRGATAEASGFNK